MICEEVRKNNRKLANERKSKIGNPKDYFLASFPVKQNASTKPVRKELVKQLKQTYLELEHGERV